MSGMLLVRHGQASFLTDDYDKLSPAGEQQASALGHFLPSLDIQFDRGYCGARQRRKTGSAWPAPEPTEHQAGQFVLDSHALSYIVAVLDWKMSTVGSPMMDLSTMLPYWIEPDGSESLQAIFFGPTMIEGSMTRNELVHRYVDTTGYHLPNPLFYRYYWVFKLAVIVQLIYARFIRGHTRDRRFAKLNHSTPSLPSAKRMCRRSRQRKCHLFSSNR